MRGKVLRWCGCHTGRLQPSLLGSLDDAELGRIKTVVTAAQARNVQVILSPHNGGRYFLRGTEMLIGTADVPTKPSLIFQAKWLLHLPATRQCTRLA
jgi:hypothetical protein